MKPYRLFSLNNIYILTIVIVIFINHWPLLLNDGIYWDDWLWINSMDNSLKIDTLGTLANEMGTVPTFWIHVWLCNIFGFRIVTFISIIISGISVFQIGIHKKMLDSFSAMVITLLFVSYPAFQTWVLFSTAAYVFYYSIFLVGALVLIKAESFRKTNRIIFSIVALIFFYISFNLNSLLVFYFGFLLLLYYYIYRNNNLSWKQAGIIFVSRRLYLILLPFVYWIVKELFFPRHGLYANYNQFSFSPDLFIKSLISFLYNGIYEQFDDALLALISHPAIWLLGLIAVWWVCSFIVKDANKFSFKPSYLALIYGVLLLGLSMLPYILVGKHSSSTGWSTRNNLLLALPISIIILVLARLLFRNTEGGLTRLGFMFLTTLLIGFSFITITRYIDIQARWVKDQSVMVNLTELVGAEKYSTYWIDDQYFLGGENNYRFYEWSSIFKHIWGDESRIGFDKKQLNTIDISDYKKYMIERYNLSNYQPDDGQALLTINQGTSRSAFNLVSHYFYYKFFRQKLLNGFLTGVTEVTVEPLPSQKISNENF